MLKLGTWNYYCDADTDAKMGIEPNLSSDASVRRWRSVEIDHYNKTLRICNQYKMYEIRKLL